MVAKKKINSNKFFQERITRINKVLEKFEFEVEKTVETIVRRGEKSSRLLKKNFDEIVGRISSSEIYSLASEKTEELGKEVKKLADEVVAKIKRFDIKLANPVLKEIRVNLDQFIEKLQALEVVELAKDKAQSTRRQVLSVLSIPSQEDISHLTRKVANLEKKIKTLHEHKAA